MSSYYMRDGILYTTKTCCNLVETWQHEARVYPEEVKPRRINVWGMPRDWPEEYITSWLKDRDFRKLSWR